MSNQWPNGSYYTVGYNPAYAIQAYQPPEQPASTQASQSAANRQPNVVFCGTQDPSGVNRAQPGAPPIPPKPTHYISPNEARAQGTLWNAYQPPSAQPAPTPQNNNNYVSPNPPANSIPNGGVHTVRIVNAGVNGGNGSTNSTATRAAFQERQKFAAEVQQRIFNEQYPNFGANDPWAYVTDNFSPQYSYTVGPCGRCMKTNVDTNCPMLNGLYVCNQCYNLGR
ncbi:hypothetical protein VTO42DRAFT_1602 [Malbranchea cinnamomea]